MTSVLINILLVGLGSAAVYTWLRARAVGNFGLVLVSATCGVLVITLVITRFVFAGSGFSDIRSQVADRTDRDMFICMEYFGRYLAYRYPNHRALIIAGDRVRHEAAMAAMKRGASERLTFAAEVFSPSLETPNHWHYNFMQAVVENSDCDLVISLIGLPRDFRRSPFAHLPPSSRPELVVVNADTSRLRRPIARGVISAAVVPNPNYVIGEEDQPSDIELAFAERYLIVDRANVKQIDAAFPNLFVN